ncbi:tRNA-dihydrouridine(20a/20b) synthase [NAD(P)+]-like [Styela clava]
MVERISIPDLLNEDRIIKICAPMVRYSRRAFRMLVRKYGCDLAYTPMIISNSFAQSKQCRDNEFQPHELDRPLVVQFAASNAKDFADATEIVFPDVDGVGLNCGCPQRWAMAEGYGAKLIKNPELVRDIIKTTRNRIPSNDFSISVKIRILETEEGTVDMCRQFESAGASYIAVHGRTTKERNQPPHYDIIKSIKDSVDIPVVANGGIKTPHDIERIHEITGVNGVMVAQGLLNNPAMFGGYEKTPVQCIEDWLSVTEQFETIFQHFHNHLIYMQKYTTPKWEKQVFNNLKHKKDILDYLSLKYEL